ncbi:hypothetical protein M409DRAFT_49698 [Zasmidium cellare ATCC 36951]|uniref:TAFII55 protein conserved region domain-containing protein n=1 Tax=Zasmidium cellare ATCC 36951 TaxID=1080233 RepID=A0A6A6D2A9_ZASCE|nr:uncharacterized protein M409DRAFT_49698 [Zasmidium cellare ATCC 36951]KAF2173223.1 hypothetical protein M409DRAFT_49698 [Zasmidium cellare ATCC 36951]
MIKLKLGNRTPSAASTDGQPPAAQNAGSPQPASSSVPAPVKLKLSVSQPPTPIEQSGQPAFPTAPEAPSDKKKRPYQRKQDGSAKSKKRAADADNSPAAKRVASGTGLGRKLSIKPPAPQGSVDVVKPKIQLGKRKSSVPKILDLRARGKAPPRPKGVGYDSEDSDTEKDPALQQGLVLRMEDGEDAQYLKEAIAKGQVGPHPSQGDAEVSVKFIEKNYRRAIIKIRGRMYAAALVDIPCIVESMKSFDKKGWWKVADISQMLLVLGRCNSEEEAKTYALPKEVNKDNFQYAHGLTPPMHWVRKRRFRKRMNYNEIANVEEEVEKLLKADEDWEKDGGTVTTITPAEQEKALEAQAYDEYDEDAEGEAIETVETDGQEYEEEVPEGEEDPDLEANLQAMFDAEGDMDVSELVTESPAPIADQAASMSAVENAMQEDFTPIGTPAGGVGMTPQEPTSDEEEESDEDEEDSPDVVDEDAAAKAAERAQQLEEVADLEREVERARQKVQAMTNQLLRQREMQKLASLEEDLRVKKQVFGLVDPED